jgi:hypothetical protein
VKIGIYASQQSQGHAALASCLAAKPGYSVTWEKAGRFGAPKSYDVVLVHGQREPMASIVSQYREAGIAVLVSDLPRWRALPHEIGIFFGGLHGMPPEGVAGRREALLPEAIGPMRSGGSHLYVIGQKPNDAAHGMNVFALQRSLDALASHYMAETGLPVRFRHHPKGHERVQLTVPHTVEMPEQPIDFTDAAMVLTVNSTVGLEALMAGVPVVCNPSAYYAPWTTPDADRADLLDRVLATQWSVEELADGTAWTFLQAWMTTSTAGVA